jgi:hypothetical protein
MPLQATSGAASYDAFGGGAAAVPQYIEDVFSTYLYTGNGSTQTITNGIDLAGKGGLVWIKQRSPVADYIHNLYDTARGLSGGFGLRLQSNATSAQATTTGTLSSFNSNGFSLGDNVFVNNSPNTFASWTFRKQPKFFDVVTYSGSSSTQNITHNLGSVPGCIIVKRTSGVEDWFVYHTSLGNTQYLKLNGTGAAASGFAAWNNTSPTSTQFTVLGGRTEVNAAGSDYVAYLFAHNAGGFGLTGTDNVISCGSFTGSSFNVNLGYEPQWIMFKRSDDAGQWFMLDTMRGDSLTAQSYVKANASDAESTNPAAPGYPAPTATGFYGSIGPSGAEYIYIAIRRGPMKVPTSGTSVFAPLSVTPVSGPTTTFTTNFPVDLLISKNRQYESNNLVQDRLRGGSVNVITNGTRAEESGSGVLFDSNVKAVSTDWGTGFGPIIGWNFRRAPNFFDEVCYTTGAGTGITTFNHNLTVTPELVISKVRSAVDDWYVYAQPLGTSKTLYLNANVAEQGFTCTDSLSSTQARTTLGVGSATAVSYLFATCAGVSKVGSYTGTATTKQIDCGFTAGARFVLIKRTDSTGAWYVWDSARGIVSGNDPYLLLNSDVAEVTNTDYVDTYSAGFEISSTAPAAINASGGTFVFLAIA